MRAGDQARFKYAEATSPDGYGDVGEVQMAAQGASITFSAPAFFDPAVRMPFKLTTMGPGQFYLELKPGEFWTWWGIVECK